jgi:hypothetical protein
MVYFLNRKTNGTRPSEENHACLRVARIYLLSVSGIMFVLGLMKLISATGAQLLLQELDPIIPMTNKFLFIVSGCVEIAISVILLWHVSVTLKLKLLAWISLVFVCYHLILRAYHWHGNCPCLGNATEWLHLSPRAANTLVGAFIMYFLFGSLLLLIYISRGRPGREVVAEGM